MRILNICQLKLIKIVYQKNDGGGDDDEDDEVEQIKQSNVYKSGH